MQGKLIVDDVVSEVRLDTRTSGKTGKPYSMLVVQLENGYAYETFIDKPVEFMIRGLLEGAKKA